MIEIGSGTVAHVIDTDAVDSDSDSGFSFDRRGPGDKMCSRGYRHLSFHRVSFATFVDYHDIEKIGFEGDAPEEIWPDAANRRKSCV
ncbi:hypothetical protein [Natronorarus salvus]|uniref:hypothetical protein n=1 Tax=Natronorarus salvus TaxID=3117733 RepID=UPI002F26455C